MPFAIEQKLEGLEGVLASLAAMSGKAAKNRATRPAVTKVTRMLAKAVKKKVPKRVVNWQTSWRILSLDLLRKSIIAKIKTGKSGVVGVVGPKNGMKTQVGVVTRGYYAGQPIYEDPAKIAHLVEFGHGGPHPAPPHPFMRPAVNENISNANSLFQTELAAGIEKELKRAAEKAAKKAAAAA